MENVFLICFLFGAIFTLASTLLGSLGPDAELGSLGKLGKVGKVGKIHLDGVEIPHTADGGLGDFFHGYFTLSAMVAFVTWFGAAGYLLLKLTALHLALILPVAVAGGVVGGGVIAWVLKKIKEGDTPMNPEDYRLEGTVAKVSISVPANGVGEIVFSLAGTRRREAARTEQGQPVPDGTEVVITRYERGVALIQPVQTFLAEEEQERLRRLAQQQNQSPTQE